VQGINDLTTPFLVVFLSPFIGTFIQFFVIISILLSEMSKSLPLKIPFFLFFIAYFDSERVSFNDFNFFAFWFEFVEGDVETCNVDQIDPKNLAMVEADAYWCVSKFIDSIQVTEAVPLSNFFTTHTITLSYYYNIKLSCYNTITLTISQRQ
jgi:hypothetical protein